MFKGLSWKKNRSCGPQRSDQSSTAVWGSWDTDLLRRRSCAIPASSRCEKNRAIPCFNQSPAVRPYKQHLQAPPLFSGPVIRLECGAQMQSVERVLTPLGGVWPFWSTLLTATLTSAPLVILIPGDLLASFPAPAPPAPPPVFKHLQQVNVASIPWRKRSCMKQ